jgi:hypothetical protein
MNTKSQNEEYFITWSETHVLMTVSFWWSNHKESGECRLHNRTFNQALAIAKEQGFVEPKWFKPWTWYNGVVTVG